MNGDKDADKDDSKMKAAGKIDARKKYNEAVLEAAMQGEPQPPPFEEWLASNF